MPEDFDSNHPTEEEESFADMLEAFSSNRQEGLNTGDKISAEIISIGRDAVFVDTGTKIDGFVAKSELLDDKGELACRLGDKLDLYVVSASESRIELSTGLAGVGGLMHAEEAWRNGTPLDGKVLERCKGGFRVTVAGQKAFCPISQIDLRYAEDPDAYVGSAYRFKITQFEENGRNIVVSRRDILEKEAEKARRLFYENAAIGECYEGKVTRIEAYGVFVEILPAIEGMVHVSEIGWSRSSKPEALFKIGDRVTAKLIGIEQTTSSQKLKISLSVKQTIGDPWERVEDDIKPGDKVGGTVTRCMDFGAFVELSSGIEGLVHISEMSYTKRVLKPDELVKEGDRISVMVKEIDAENRRISLSLKDAEGDPWLDVAEKYPIGKSVEGIIENKENFGFFVQLEPGVTGLLPKSRIADSYDAASIEKLKAGDAISVVPEEIDPGERKITLAPGDSEEMRNWQRYSTGSSSPLGALGEKLQEALEKQNKE